MQKKPKSAQERPVPKIEAKEPFTTASAHTAVRNGFCIRLGQPWDAKVTKYTANHGTAWCRWAWLGLAGRGLARPGMLLSLKDAKENPDHHRRPSTGGGLLFCPLESPGASPRCPLGLAGLPKRRNSGTGAREWPFSRIIRQLRGNDTALLPCRDGYGSRWRQNGFPGTRQRFASPITLHASVPLSSRLSINALASASIPGRAASCLTKCLARSASHSCPIKTDIWPNNNFRG